MVEPKLEVYLIAAERIHAIGSEVDAFQASGISRIATVVEDHIVAVDLVEITERHPKST